MPSANQLELVERVVIERLRRGALTRKPTEEEWAEAWQLLKARPEMSPELVADTVFAGLKRIDAREPLPFADRARMLAVRTVMPPMTAGTKPCSGCGAPIASNATTCPHCGKRHSTTATIVAAILIALVLGYGSCVFVVPR